MKNKIRKRLVRFLLIPLVSLIVLIVAAIAILYSQQQRLVDFAVSELNKQLPVGELVVGGSDISAFQNFPYISIGLKNVQFYDNKQKAGKPLFEAERIFAGFSLPDILKQKYRVKVIALKNGHADLVKDCDGLLNIVEAARMNSDSTAPKNTKPTDLDLDIKKLVIKNMNVSYLDLDNGQQASAHIDRIQSSFKDNDEQIDADLQSDLVADYTQPGNVSLLHHKRLQTDIRLSYTKLTKLLKLPEGKLKLEDAGFDITGTADLLHDNTVDFKFSGNKLDFRQLFAFAPEEVAKELKHFRYDGHLTFDGTVKGKLQGGKLPLIALTFSCRDAWLHNTKANKKLDSLAFKGYYTNGPGQSLQTSELRLLDVSARPGKGIFRGNFVMRDFTDPKMLMQINSDLELEFIGAFLGIKDLERITGHINLKMDFKELEDISMPEQSLAKLTEGIQSELKVTNLSFRIPHFPFTVEHLDLHAAMKNGFLKLDTLSFKVGHSDFQMDGSLSDLPAIFHHQQKPVLLTLNARSSKMILKELLAADTNQLSEAKEEIYGLNMELSMETSVDELRHPKPLPKGKFIINDLYAEFKNYPHALHDLGAELTINDTSLVLNNFNGQIDSTDFKFNGRVNNYTLWFDKVMRGKTQVAFDLKSHRLSLKDLLGRNSGKYMPKGYEQETFANVWLRSKTDLRYDSVFKFANINIGHISGDMMQHPFDLDSISGNVKIGADNFIKIDTLTGKIGNTDFNLNMRLYAGKDTVKRKKENFLLFSSRLLDIDQLTNYWDTVEEEVAPIPTDDTLAVAAVAKTATSAHTDAFNIFKIPFIDFRATATIGRIKYKHLGMKHLYTNLRMQANQQLYLDTLSMQMADGQIAAQAHFDGSNPEKIYLKSSIHVEDVNIEKLMLKLDNMGEDYVINKNIKGILSGQVESLVQVHPDLTPLMNQSEAKLDLEILNGVLVNFAPMQAMSSYFKDKNLNMVRFDTLQNTLLFKNGVLSIPDMNINSSLGFMEISGKQSMDMQMEYDLRIPLKMVTQVGFHMLFGKKKEEVDPDQVDAIDYRDKEKKIRFMNIVITGTPDAYKVHLGKAKKSKLPG